MVMKCKVAINFFLFQLILGGSDEEYFNGPMDYFPVVNDGRWIVQLKSVVSTQIYYNLV